MRLKISGENKRYFEYRGKPVPLVGSGLGGDLPRGKNLKELQEVGVNQYLWLTTPSLGRPHPYKLDPGYHVDNNWGGFFDSYWQDLGNYAGELQKKDCFLFAFLFSTCARKKGKDTWPAHLWNAANGGPIAAADGVFPFYELGSPGFLYGERDYEELITWQEKSQYRQEQLVHIFVKTLAPYLNTGIVLMWELFTGFDSPVNGPLARKWICHMVRYVRSLSDMPVGIGTWHAPHLEYVRKETDIDVFAFMEGVVPSYPLSQGKKRPDLLPTGSYPIMVDGWQAQLPDTRYSINHKTRKCKYFFPGMEKENVANICGHMVESLRLGANISLPFDFWWNKITRYVTRDCREDFPQIEDYDSKFARQEIFKFMARLKEKTAAIDWTREPGAVLKEDWGDDIIPFKKELEEARPDPVFTFGPGTGAAPLKVAFDASASRAADDSSLVGYTWDFGDGGAMEGKQVAYEFKEPGNYPVTLRVVDDRGRDAQVSHILVVWAAPVSKSLREQMPLPDGTDLEILVTNAGRQIVLTFSCPESVDPARTSIYRRILAMAEHLPPLVECFGAPPGED